MCVLKACYNRPIGDVKIPLAFLFTKEADELLNLVRDNRRLVVRIASESMKPGTTICISLCGSRFFN